jgi:Mn2+/Fe2+ NRAMP family transporter
LILLIEQAGRLSAVSGRTVVDAIRERFGFNYAMLLLTVLGAVMLLVLSAEIGGVCIAIEFLTGVNHQWWAIPVGIVTWLVIWKGTFGFIEQGVSLLGLVTICFIVATWKLNPNWRHVAAGLLPTPPTHDMARYWFVAVSILGASISPYLVFFYSSGAIEDRWDASYLTINRVISVLGMSFGSLISMAVLIVAAVAYSPRGIQVDHYSELAGLLTDVFGRWGLLFVACSLAISCFGASLEIALELAYLVAQTFGWNWGENHRPKEEARFSLVYIIAIVAATILLTIGFDPLTITIFSMVLTAATLPVAVIPFLILMNDTNYMGEHSNSMVGNVLVILITGLSFVLAIVSLPLQIVGGG